MCVVGNEELVPTQRNCLKVVAERATESESHLEGGRIHCTDRVCHFILFVVTYGEQNAARKSHAAEDTDRYLRAQVRVSFLYILFHRQGCRILITLSTQPSFFIKPFKSHIFLPRFMAGPL